MANYIVSLVLQKPEPTGMGIKLRTLRIIAESDKEALGTAIIEEDKSNEGYSILLYSVVLISS